MSFLKKLEYSFWRQSQNLVKGNEKFFNSHKGEVCFILGNGSSLKYFDLSVLSNLTTIGCTYSLIDNRLKDFGLNYCVLPSAYLMIPVWKSRKTGKLELNSLSPIFRKIIKDNPKTEFFMSLTDRYSFLRLPENVNFIYHFGNKNSNSFDMSASFSIATSGLDFMLGVAKYLGFSKIVLLGCDYLGAPCMESHFYSTREPFKGEYKDEYVQHIKHIVDILKLDVTTVFPEGINSPAFKSQSFSEYFGVDEHLYHQSQIIDDDYLHLLRKADSKRQLYL